MLEFTHKVTFATGVENKATGDSKLHDSPVKNTLWFNLSFVKRNKYSTFKSYYSSTQIAKTAGYLLVNSVCLNCICSSKLRSWILFADFAAYTSKSIGRSLSNQDTRIETSSKTKTLQLASWCQISHKNTRLTNKFYLINKKLFFYSKYILVCKSICQYFSDFRA